MYSFVILIYIYFTFMFSFFADMLHDRTSSDRAGSNVVRVLFGRGLPMVGDPFVDAGVRQATQTCRDPHGVLCCRGWAFRHPQKARPLSTSPRVGLICLVLLLPAFSFAPHKSRWNCLPWLTMPSALGSVLHLSRLPSTADPASRHTRLPFL